LVSSRRERGVQAEDEGRARGRVEGIEQGRSEGLVRGRQEGLERGRGEGLEEGLERGREEGLERGREEGRLAGQRDMVETMLRGRFGELDAAHRQAVHAADEQQLAQMMARVVTADAIADVFES